MHAYFGYDITPAVFKLTGATKAIIIYKKTYPDTPAELAFASNSTWSRVYPALTLVTLVGHSEPKTVCMRFDHHSRIAQIVVERLLFMYMENNLKL